MSPELEDWAAQFDDAYYRAYEIYRDNGQVPSPAEYQQLAIAATAAREILEHLGFIEPFECGECDECHEKRAARAAEMLEALENDPALSPHHNGTALSADDEATARALLGDVFGRPTRDES